MCEHQHSLNASLDFFDPLLGHSSVLGEKVVRSSARSQLESEQFKKIAKSYERLHLINLRRKMPYRRFSLSHCRRLSV